MKLYLAIVLCFTICLKCSESAELPDNIYSKYENVDVDKILQNRRILTSYIKCIVDEGPCTPEGRDLRKYLPDALRNGACAKCSNKQKENVRKAIVHLRDNRKSDWDRIVLKFDPTGEYRKKYEGTL